MSDIRWPNGQVNNIWKRNRVFWIDWHAAATCWPSIAGMVVRRYQHLQLGCRSQGIDGVFEYTWVSSWSSGSQLKSHSTFRMGSSVQVPQWAWRIGWKADWREFQKSLQALSLNKMILWTGSFESNVRMVLFFSELLTTIRIESS